MADPEVEVPRPMEMVQKIVPDSLGPSSSPHVRADVQPASRSVQGELAEQATGSGSFDFCYEKADGKRAENALVEAFPSQCSVRLEQGNALDPSQAQWLEEEGEGVGKCGGSRRMSHAGLTDGEVEVRKLHDVQAEMEGNEVIGRVLQLESLAGRPASEGVAILRLYVRPEETVLQGPMGGAVLLESDIVRRVPVRAVRRRVRVDRGNGCSVARLKQGFSAHFACWLRYLHRDKIVAPL